jgi:hypothetical protein
LEIIKAVLNISLDCQEKYDERRKEKTKKERTDTIVYTYSMKVLFTA